jgi:ankyrin repeat protein
MVELFLSAGADPLATTDDGRTSDVIADEAGHPDVARRLREVAQAASEPAPEPAP